MTHFFFVNMTIFFAECTNIGRRMIKTMNPNQKFGFIVLFYLSPIN